jgi:TonB family protein
MSYIEVYSPREIAGAAGVPEEQVIAALGSADFVRHSDAVRIGRGLRAHTVTPVGSGFSRIGRIPRSKSMPLAVSSTLHAGFLGAVVFVTTLGISPAATTLRFEDRPAENMRLVFLTTPGPGGGGGGGGALQKPPPPKAERKGRSPVSSPMPARRPPRPIAPPVRPAPEPPPLNSEPLPVVSAPIVQAPADNRDRFGVLEEARTETPSRGSGEGGGVGAGAGTGIGQGDGPGVGQGSGGGTGGGPFRPGSGIEAPRLLREVRADYSEDARRRGVEGDVLLEIIVRRDGSVGDVKILRRLGAGLDERAVQAVRQWRFAPAKRLGTPVDVIVEVAVEFKLR